MDLSDLNIFRTVVEAGGITKAADRLHRVQSNVTTRVRQLEEDLGVKLFIREGKRLHLSPAGQTLLTYAERLLTLAEEARASVQDATPRGVLRLGSMESTAGVRLPAPLTVFHKRYPEVTIELRTGNPAQLARLILEGELDAALVAEPIADEPFEKELIYREALVLIAPANQTAINFPSDSVSKTLLAFENGCPHRKRLEDWFADQGELPEKIIELGSYHAMLGCTVAGMGVSLLPAAVLDGFPMKEHLSTHPLPPGQDYAETVLIWRKGAGSPKIDALLEVLEETRPKKMFRRKKRAV
ncbi:MAG: LysR family transcriptional regulator [Alphaproteobacteria bacterium]|jgi:DNA-binding transcriptional LysR family regulator|nr:LysR family transcriptional regulator [Alphaproteobacteria bacterium]